jgi:hypothetical protein
VRSKKRIVFYEERIVMTHLTRIFILTLILAFSLTGCGLRERLREAGLPDDWREQGAAAATRAAEAMADSGEVAATAAAAAATAAAHGGEALATAQAAGLLPAVDVEALKERMANVQPDGSGNVTVTISDAEVNQALQAAQRLAAQSGQILIIQDAQVRFQGGLITVNGRVSQPVAAPLRAVFRPQVQHGVLQFALVEATLGNSSLPQPLLNQAEALLNSTLGEAVSNLPTGFTLQEVMIGTGTMTVVAQR